MLTEICAASDAEAIARFREVLRSLEGDVAEVYWAIGVNAYRMRIGAVEITIYSDAWSVDVEGPEALVCLLRDAVNSAPPRLPS